MTDSNKNQILVHVAAEAVLIISSFVYFQQRTSKHGKIIEDMARRIEKLEDMIDEQASQISRMYQPPKPQQVSRSTQTQPMQTQTQPMQMHTQPMPQVHTQPMSQIHTQTQAMPRSLEEFIINTPAFGGVFVHKNEESKVQEVQEEEDIEISQELQDLETQD